ncbi:splicing factor YJU2 [Arctopsyche grandis]|uniref:splicing factor YJU2 n=1 Tax=Arctopsyche grandis TaxID=121162 RepID=UPI00406D9FC9
MSERKVLNKYYPPDFDPSKIPRMKLAKNRQYTVRLMAPFNMRCVTCGEYIYKGKKFNARKEDVENQDYLGIRIYRFYIKCTRCLQEISFKTDPKNTDYEIEAGATRNFMALKLAVEQAKREEDELKEEEANNPMKLLENRTEQSRNEIELLESLEELKDLNRRQAAVDYDTMLQQYVGETAEARRVREEKEDEDFLKSVKFQNKNRIILAEEIIEEIEEDDSNPVPFKRIKKESDDSAKASSTVTSFSGTLAKSTKPAEPRNKSIGSHSMRGGLSNLVRVKKPNAESNNEISGQIKNSENSNVSDDKPKPPAASGLSLLAGYSDSDSNNSADES